MGKSKTMPFVENHNFYCWVYYMVQPPDGWQVSQAGFCAPASQIISSVLLLSSYV